MFSVVIPLYNKPESVRHTLQSALNQSFQEFEIVVVDDGSTDESASLVAAVQDKRIRLIRQANAGVSAARNRSIREARYPYVAFLDADDIWEADYLLEAAGMIEEFPGAVMYGCAYDKVKPDRVLKQKFHLQEGFRGYVDNYFAQARKHMLFWTSAVIIDKDKTASTGWFDERICIMGEDLDLWFRIALEGRVAFHNKVLAHYNLGAENRGMLRSCPFEKSIMHYADKYKTHEAGDKEFRLFINVFRLRKIPEVFLYYGLDRKTIKDFLKTIDYREQKWKHRAFMSLPYTLQKMFIRLLFGNPYSA